MSRRALILAGGGMRVAWQAGAVRALHEADLRFDHGDGTSGGIFTLAMLLSGVGPTELGERWRTLDLRRSISLLPWRRYLRGPTNLPSLGDARGLVGAVFPHLGIDVDAIRRATAMTGTFNVADFSTKTCVAIPHTEIDLPRLTAGISLPIFLPAVEAHGRTWTDAVWIKDANLLDAVQRGCTELWVLWCIANTPEWGRGPLEQYVHMIELSANGALFAELAEIAEINARRRAGEAVHGTTEPVVVHVVKPRYPLPLDPDFLAGRVEAETLVAMGYRDTRAYLDQASDEGVALDPSATAMPAPPLGARFTLRGEGHLGDDRVALHLTGEVADVAAFVAEPRRGTSLVGWLRHARWGPLPLDDGRFRVGPAPGGGRRFSMAGRVAAPDGPLVLRAHLVLPARHRLRALWGASLALRLDDETGRTVALGSVPLRPADLARLAWSFEPSGAHDLADRWSVLRQTAGFLARRGRPEPHR